MCVHGGGREEGFIMEKNGEIQYNKRMDLVWLWKMYKNVCLIPSFFLTNPAHSSWCFDFAVTKVQDVSGEQFID